MSVRNDPLVEWFLDGVDGTSAQVVLLCAAMVAIGWRLGSQWTATLAYNAQIRASGGALFLDRSPEPGWLATIHPVNDAALLVFAGGLLLILCLEYLDGR